MHDIEERRALRTQRPAVHRVIRIPLDMDDVGLRVLRAVAKAIDEDAASDGAIGAGVAGLRRRRQLEGPNGRRQSLAGSAETKSAKTRGRQTSGRAVGKYPAAETHAR